MLLRLGSKLAIFAAFAALPLLAQNPGPCSQVLNNGTAGQVLTAQAAGQPPPCQWGSVSSTLGVGTGLFSVNVTQAPYNAQVGGDASAAFLAAAKACVTAGGGSLAVPSFGTMYPWQVSVTLPFVSHCHWIPAPDTTIQETGQGTDLFESMELSGETFVPIAGYSGGVITNAYAAFGAGSATGVIDTGINCPGRCTFDGLIDSKTGSANDSKGINYYGTSLYLSGHPMVWKNFHGDCIDVDFNNTAPVSWGFEDIFDTYTLLNCGASPTTGNVVVAGAVGISFGGPTDTRSTGRESANNACWSIYVGANAAAVQDQHFHDGGVNTNSTGCGIDLIEGASYKASGGEVEGAVNVANIVVLSQSVNWDVGTVFQSGGSTSYVPMFQFGQQAASASFARSLRQTTPGNPTPVAGAATSFYATDTLIGDGVNMIGNPGSNGAYYFAAEGDSYYGGSAYLTGGAYTGGYLDGGTPSIIGLKAYGISGCSGLITSCSRPAQTLANNATLYYLDSTGVPYYNVPINPAAAYTGIVIEAPASARDRQIAIYNTSANTLVLAVSGSNCSASVVTAGIKPGKTVLNWDTGSALWY